MVTQALILDGRQMALELHALLRDLDPARLRGDFEQALRERIEQLETRLAHLLESWQGWQEGASLRQRFWELHKLLKERIPRPDLQNGQWREEWKRYHQQLQTAYHSLSQSLQAWSIHVPSLRPTNYARNLFHSIAALFVLCLIQLILVTPKWMLYVSGGFALWAWSMEIGRRFTVRGNDFLMKIFGPLAHPHEWYRVNSATWYSTALVLLALLGSPMIASIAVVVLGFGDPAAALIGRRFGRIRLIHGRSLEGTLSFFVVATCAAWAMMLVFYRSVGIGYSLAIVASAAALAALAELFSKRIDDNLSVPLTAALGALVMIKLLGL